MSRSCKVCKKNNNQAFFSCGYIKKADRSGKKTDFPIYNDHSFFVDICPVWYYNSFPYFYRIYNYIKNGIKKDLTWHDRFIFNIAEGYNNLLEKERIKNLKNKG